MIPVRQSTAELFTQPVLAHSYRGRLATFGRQSPLLSAFAASSVPCRWIEVGVFCAIWVSFRTMCVELPRATFVLVTAPLQAASPATTLSGCGVNVCILWRVWMAVLAMSFCLIQQACFLSGFTSLDVYAVSNWFQVAWVYAGRVATQMVEFKPVAYWANKQLIGKLMCAGDSSSIPELSVSQSLGCSPQPAIVGFGNFLPEPLLCRCR
jgi:hypothetical protein